MASLDLWMDIAPSKRKQLVEAFHAAAIFLLVRIAEDGWHWSSNYLREHVRCTTDLRFSNSLSPHILRALVEAHPKLRKHIDLGVLTA